MTPFRGSMPAEPAPPRSPDIARHASISSRCVPAVPGDRRERPHQEPNLRCRIAPASIACSASRQPVSRSPRLSWRDAGLGGAQVLHPDADQAQPHPLQPGRRVQLAGGGVDLLGRRRSARCRVRDRVMVVKSARRSFTLTVRPTWPASRSRAATRSDSRSSSRLITSGSSMSAAKVSSAPMLLSGTCGVTRRSSRPQASAARWLPRPGRARAAAWRRAPWAGRRPCGCRAGPGPARCAPPRPTAPPRAAGGGTPPPRRPGTTSMPSGLHCREASLATNFCSPPPPSR